MTIVEKTENCNRNVMKKTWAYDLNSLHQEHHSKILWLKEHFQQSWEEEVQ